MNPTLVHPSGKERIHYQYRQQENGVNRLNPVQKATYLKKKTNQNFPLT